MWDGINIPIVMCNHFILNYGSSVTESNCQFWIMSPMCYRYTNLRNCTWVDSNHWPTPKTGLLYQLSYTHLGLSSSLSLRRARLHLTSLSDNDGERLDLNQRPRVTPLLYQTELLSPHIYTTNCWRLSTSLLRVFL